MDPTPSSLGAITVGSLYSDVARRYGAPPRQVPVDEEKRACDYVKLPNLPAGVALMVFGDTIVRIDVDTTEIPTREGVGVGTNESEVLAKYAGRVRVESHPYSGPEWHYVIVTPAGDSTHRMIFETDGTRVRSFRVGFRRAVAYSEGCS